MEWYLELPGLVHVFFIFCIVTLISVIVRKSTGVNLELGGDYGNKSKKCTSCLSVIPFEASTCRRCGTSQFTQTQAVAQHSSLAREKTCPACISQVPFIASKCKFCGTDLEVQDLGGGRPSISDQINASNMKNQDKAANIENPDFPNSPEIGDRHTAGSSTWKWEGNKWNLE